MSESLNDDAAKRSMGVSYEDRPFTNQLFYRFIKKAQRAEDVSTLHYANAIEILFCENVVGQVTVGTEVFSLTTKKAFYIAPNVIHSTIFFPTKNSDVYVVQISLEHLKVYLDIQQCMLDDQRSLYDISVDISDLYDELFAIVIEEIDGGKNILEKVMGVAHFFSVLQSKVSAQQKKEIGGADHLVRKIIAWTEAHYVDNFTLDYIADQMYLSKYYFCHYFKKMTGKTYVDYLQEFRVSKAIEMIRRGCSLTECCFACGFNNLSYFSRVFRKVTGFVPSQYKLHYFK